MRRPLAGLAPSAVNPEQPQADLQSAGVQLFNLPIHYVALLERGPAAVAGVEVKAAATVRPSDFRGLRKLAVTVGDRFACGVVLYDGELTARFGDRLHAVPVRRLWEAA